MWFGSWNSELHLNSQLTNPVLCQVDVRLVLKTTVWRPIVQLVCKLQLVCLLKGFLHFPQSHLKVTGSDRLRNSSYIFVQLKPTPLVLKDLLVAKFNSRGENAAGTSAVNEFSPRSFWCWSSVSSSQNHPPKPQTSQVLLSNFPILGFFW